MGLAIWIVLVSAWLTLWQLPQNLLAVIIIGLYKLRGVELKITNFRPMVWMVTVKNGSFGVSLGMFIILGDNWYHSSDRVKLHEYGHCLQSQMLGPLYLFTVGIVSVTLNLISRIYGLFGSRKFVNLYYQIWPEKWADKLGGVTPDMKYYTL